MEQEWIHLTYSLTFQPAWCAMEQVKLWLNNQASNVLSVEDREKTQWGQGLAVLSAEVRAMFTAKSEQNAPNAKGAENRAMAFPVLCAVA